MSAIDHIIAHYAEIGLKAQNRGHFERLLIRNIQAKLGRLVAGCHRESGQITLALAPAADVAAAVDALKRVPGIAHFAPARRVEPTLEALGSAALEAVAGRAFATFKVETHRPNKRIALRSMDVNREIGGVILAALPDRKVRLAAPDLTVKIELADRGAYVSVDRYEGVGGMPTNPRQRVVALLSGGIDSPVAAYLLMKRGCAVVLVHFQNRNQMTGAVEDKITQLAAQLARYQVRTRLHIVPFEDLQRAIITQVHSSTRMLMYRRLMLDLAARIARAEHARFLVTGDSLSQVASQTYDNLSAIYGGCPLPVLTPLIGADKREIVAVAERIGTFAISAQPYEDCCSFFVPKHPELRAQREALDEQAGAMDLEPLIAAALAATRLQEW